jgi:hypothetical protein
MFAAVVVAVWLLGIPVAYRGLNRPQDPLSQIQPGPSWAFIWPLLVVMLLDIRGWLLKLKRLARNG